MRRDVAGVSEDEVPIITTVDEVIVRETRTKMLDDQDGLVQWPPRSSTDRQVNTDTIALRNKPATKDRHHEGFRQFAHFEVHHTGDRFVVRPSDGGIGSERIDNRRLSFGISTSKRDDRKTIILALIHGVDWLIEGHALRSRCRRSKHQFHIDRFRPTRRWRVNCVRGASVRIKLHGDLRPTFRNLHVHTVVPRECLEVVVA